MDAGLVDRFARAQATTAARAWQEISPLWRIIDPARIDATAAEWLNLATPMVQAFHAEAAEVARIHLDEMRYAATGSRHPAASGPPIPEGQVRTSLLTTGPYEVKRLIARGTSPEVALRIIGHRQIGPTTRLVQAGTRSTVRETAKVDPAAEGRWARVTNSPKPCRLCATTASRGHVYLTARTAGRDDRWHDHCYCTAIPGYVPLPESSRRWVDAWKDAKKEAGETGARTEDVFAALVKNSPTG